MSVAGCGSSNNSTQTQTPSAAAEATKDDSSNTTENKDDPVEIEFVWMNPAWDVIEYGKDPVTAKFVKDTGVTLKCSAPQGDWQQVANVWLASGDYPEMMNMDVSAIFDQYIAAGALLPINQLADEYGYEKITNGEYIYPEVINAWKKNDGNFYLAPNWFSSEGFGSVGQTVNVRNDIYNMFGKPELKTMDDLYNFLIQIKDANLTSLDGVKLWPLTYSQSDTQYLCYLANFWGSKIYMYNYFDEADQKVKFMLRNDTIVSMLEWLNKCYK
ncbi:MAG: extracellular solute-binding protein, partial [Prevotella sp.]|nr:extracellular solute-binding protein [Prevotella sp.]